jgi:hypothetical protein
VVSRILWRDLPLLNFAFYALAIAHAEIANLTPPRPEYWATCIFPLAVPLVVYAVRWRAADRRERLVSVAVIAVTLIALGASRFLAPRDPYGDDQLRRIYEVSSIANTALLLAHAWSFARARALWLLGPAALYGLLLENGGILLGFFSEMHYELYLGPLPAPLATMAGWVLVFYVVTWVTWELRAHLPALRRSPWLSAGVAAAAGLALGLQIDPLATAVGFWRWHRVLPGAIFDVPLVNFVAWGCAIFPFAAFVFWRQAQHGLSPEQVTSSPHGRWLLYRVPLVLFAASVMFLLVSAVTEVGVSGPTYAVLRASLVRLGVSDPDLAWTP